MKKFIETDYYFMHYALNLAYKVKGATFPNPAVGAVVVKQGKIVGTGATKPYGGNHAEKVALKSAGENAKNAALYVTLEPCCHFGQTSPCTQTIVEAGIKKVVVAVKDSNPLVNGRGIRFLRNKKIEVSVGIMSEEASALNEDFFWSITHRLPWITLKLASTLDGKIADSSGNSKWITNKSSRTFVHELRRRHAAVAIGRETLIKDNPQLTVRYVKGASPVRIVFTSDTTIPEISHFQKDAEKYRSIIFCKGGKKGRKENNAKGIKIWYSGYKKNDSHLKAFLPMAYDEGLTSILVEGGQKLASSFLEFKLVNRLYIFYSNTIIGQGVESFSFSKKLTIDRNIHLTEIKTRSFDDNIMVTGIPCWEK